MKAFLPAGLFELTMPPPCPTLLPPEIIHGWDEFHRWGRLNDPTWSGVTNAVEHGQITEGAAWRYLAAAMLSQAYHYRKLMIEAAQAGPTRVVLINPKDGL